MMRGRVLRRLWGLLACCALVLTACGSPQAAAPLMTPQQIPVRQDTLRIFWVTGYALDDPRTAQLQTGLREALANQGYSMPSGNLQLDTYYMGLTHRMQPAEAATLATEAIQAIQAFAPDVVVVSGDAVAQALIPDYPDPTLPFVFCNVYGEPEELGLALPNVTGVVVRPRIVETLRIAQAFLPEATRFMLLTDASAESTAQAEALYREGLISSGFSADSLLRSVDTWAEWQQAVLVDAADVDFIVLLDYTALLEVDGQPVSARDVLRWTVENSPTPVFGLWQQTVIDGAVGGLVLLPAQQGAAAAARVVSLADGATPASLPISAPVNNLLSVNLAAAGRWGMQIPVEFVLAAQIEALSRPQGGQ